MYCAVMFFMQTSPSGIPGGGCLSLCYPMYPSCIVTAIMRLSGCQMVNSRRRTTTDTQYQARELLVGHDEGVYVKENFAFTGN